MIKLIFSAALLATAAPSLAQSDVAAPAQATVPVLKRGAKIVSSDGKAVGRIESVSSTDGAPVAVKVIYQSRFVSIPAATLSVSNDRLVTSLSIKDIKAL